MYLFPYGFARARPPTCRALTYILLRKFYPIPQNPLSKPLPIALTLVITATIHLNTIGSYPARQDRLRALCKDLALVLIPQLLCRKLPEWEQSTRLSQSVPADSNARPG